MNYFRDEYTWEECGSLVMKRATLLIRGTATGDRETFFLDEWQRSGSDPVIWDVTFDPECKTCTIGSFKLVDRFARIHNKHGSILDVVPKMMSMYRSHLGCVVLDITSLQQTAIMCLVAFLLKECVGELFAVYAEPEHYDRPKEGEGFRLALRFASNESVPGFSRQRRGNEQTLVGFLGFDADRLGRILEERESIQRLIPVLGFPPYRPGWNLMSLESAGRIIKEFESYSDIESCPAFSVIEALSVLRRISSQDANKSLVIAPLGTRPHTLAAAIFATQNRDVRLAYDHPVESPQRAKGVGLAHVYHLSGMLA
jgi:hypothetical protein